MDRTSKEVAARLREQRFGHLGSLALYAGWALLVSHPAAAQYGATATVERPMPAGAEEEPTVAATVVEVDERPAAHETTAELLDEVPGARARKTGGPGSFTGLSLRGAELDQTAVWFGDVPLGPVGGGAFDLSTVPVELLRRVEVFRGGAPLFLGTPGIGGVVRLVPRSDQATRAGVRVGAGSFGTWNGSASASVAAPDGSASWTSLVGIDHTKGDYPFDDDGGTRFDPSDDRVRRRQNGRVDEGFVLGHARIRAGGGTVEVLAAGFGRTGGLTGSPVEEPTHTRRSQTRLLGAASYRRPSGEGRPFGGHLSLGTLHERNRLSDRFAELSLVPRETDDRTERTFGRGAAERRLGKRATLTAVGAYTHEHYAPSDHLSRAQAPKSVRHRATAGLGVRVKGTLSGARAELLGSAWLEMAEARLVEVRDTRFGQRARSTTVAPTGRLGLALEPTHGFSLSSSFGTATRLPTLVELFGDRTFLLGDTRLEPERARTLDVGAVLKGRRGAVSGAAEARGFAVFSRDLIRYVRTARLVLVPENVDRATMMGLEAGLDGRVGTHFRTAAAVTILRTKDRTTGRALPFRPPLEVHIRPELTLGNTESPVGLGLFTAVTHVAANFTDPANRVVLRGRTLVDVGGSLSFLERRARVVATIRDLFDARPVDLVGFPLPGRRVTVELVLTTDP